MRGYGEYVRGELLYATRERLLEGLARMDTAELHDLIGRGYEKEPEFLATLIGAMTEEEYEALEREGEEDARELRSGYYNSLGI